MMQDLSLHRYESTELQDEETRLLRLMSVEESLHVYASMQRAFEWQMQLTESLFGTERRAAMIELQARLLRLNR
jgi:hypothetical protein